MTIWSLIKGRKEKKKEVTKFKLAYNKLDEYNSYTWKTSSKQMVNNLNQKWKSTLRVIHQKVPICPETKLFLNIII